MLPRGSNIKKAMEADLAKAISSIEQQKSSLQNLDMQKALDAGAFMYRK